MADTAMMQRLLQTYGAPATPENMARAAQFFASNPQALEHRAMGMRGSAIDDNSDLLGPQLDRVMQQTDRIPDGRVEVGDPVIVAPQTAAVPTPTPQSGAPVVASRAMPTARGSVEPDMVPNSAIPPQGGGDTGWLPWILGALGITLGGATVASARKAGTTQDYEAAPGYMNQNDPKVLELEKAPDRPRLTYQPKLTGPSPTDGKNAKLQPDVTGLNDAAPADAATKGGGSVVRSSPEDERAAQKRQIQAEVDAENKDAAERQRFTDSALRQQMEKQAAEARTLDTLRKAGRAVGRR